VKRRRERRGEGERRRRRRRGGGIDGEVGNGIGGGRRLGKFGTQFFFLLFYSE
jgi:hypothetical protein